MTETQFLSLARVIELVGISRSEIYRQIKAGSFPQSRAYKDLEKRRFWLSSEIKAWQQGQLGADGLNLRTNDVADEFDGLL